MMDTGLKDRVVVVTGANHGIGAAAAEAFAAEGAQVFITYLRLPPEDFGISHEEARRATTPGKAFYCGIRGESADQVVQSIRGGGGRAEAWEADLAEPSRIPELFDRAERTFGPVEVLVNNAAHCVWPSTVLTASAETIDEHFAVNTRAVALTMSEYGRRHIERGATWGRVINVSTDAAYRSTGNVWYGASKFAMESISRVAAKELGPHGITVNVVSPGPVQTGYITPEQAEEWAADCPLGRLGEPNDVADVIIFLASEQARWITGQVVYVGGGYRM
ncbi:MAG: hypothetical protein AMS16_01865 [Planctomycetes bacterium DG_58]|nr:MAG: hypothetical protein AMS16_01865 [Planctomycetes bacterium DG_58]KPK99878.1 MAG: hypothetical protein AMK75_06250 [Planctomycetes bacterium SM23_65]